MIAGVIALGVTTTGGAVGLATSGGDEPEAAARFDDRKRAAKAEAERARPALAEKLDRLKAEYEAANQTFLELFRGSTIPEENQKKAAEIQPDFAAIVDPIAELAAKAPKDPAVRDTMLWVIQKRNGSAPPEDAEFLGTTHRPLGAGAAGLSSAMARTSRRSHFDVSA
jgi:hypothetical protein